MKELEILNSYITDCDTITTYIEEETAETINEIFKNIVPFEKPDMYSYTNNKTIIIEHFEFDGYKNNKDGSDYRQKEGIINNEFNKKLKNREGKKIIYKDIIIPTATIENYIKNFISVFDEHYKKIEEYKARVIKNDKETVQTWFFIEDVSPLGSYHINKNGEFLCMTIMQLSHIINYLLEHKKVDKILYGYYNGSKKRLILIDNSKQQYNNLISDRGSVDESDYYWFEANVTGFSIPLLEIKE